MKQKKEKIEVNKEKLRDRFILFLSNFQKQFLNDKDNESI